MKRHPFAIVLSVSAVLVAMAATIIYFRFPYLLSPDKGWALFSAKLTFLSVLVAVGWLQYQYFYDIAKRFRDVFKPAWDGWIESKHTADQWEQSLIQLEAMGAKNPKSREELDKLRAKLREVEENKKQNIVWLNAQWSHFEAALSILFGIIFVLIISVIVDWLQNAPQQLHSFHEEPILISISHGSFIVSIILFFVLICYYLLRVSCDIGYFRDETRKYGEADLHSGD